MKRDVLTLPLSSEKEIIIAADNSGSIGMKKADQIQASYEIVGYYSFRVAAMECLAAGGELTAAVIHNFSGEEAWGELCEGVRKAAMQLGFSELPITGSSETNFVMAQSATGMVVMGTRETGYYERVTDDLHFAVIGKPLCGSEVKEQQQSIAPLSLFIKLLKTKGVRSIMPVGSKGIYAELKSMTGQEHLRIEGIECELDLNKSAGPSTCFIIGYEPEERKRIFRLAGTFFHPMTIKTVQ
ncbi:hypothetical protein JOC78_002519 [Bacillus ectoiniformans]|uniref:ATP-binding protein n=1 Tax=Bacillus ectoiniformans TaxID=1494429 RepID=UPI00195613CA|nr:ATP-binding protein [Bacillus ectoiniformans]MBM7649545.1 hypothetical protein [Bacillus ectoiniformans]